MANPNTNYSNIITSTWDSRSKQLADNVTNSNVILAELSRKGRVRPFSGGYKIVEPLIHTGTGAAFYSGAEELSVADADVLTASEWTIKQMAAPVVLTGLEKAQNSGGEQFVDLLEAKMTAAEASMNNLIGAGLYSLGTEYGGKTFVGLRAVVSDNGTGTVGGIAGASYSWWMNNYFSGTTTTAANVQSQLNTEWAEVVRGGDQPDVCLMGTTIWGFHMAALQGLQQFVKSETAAAGFQATRHLSMDVYLDSTAPVATTAYLLNTKYLSYRPHRDFTMKALPAVRSANQDAEVVQLVNFAALTCSNRARQGVLVGA